MSSLHELCVHFPALIIDAASSRIQVGVLRGETHIEWACSNEEAGVGVFQCIEQLGVHPQSMGAYVFCEGPGSVLGIRTVAMAIRTWTTLKPRPVFAYCSLAVVAHALARRDVAVIADARREAWHHYQIGATLRRVVAAELSGELVMPDGFRHWSTLPAGVAQTSYDLADLLPRIWQKDLFHATEAPDAFLHAEPSYVTWTPRVHRAPGER